MQQESFTVEQAMRAMERYCAYQERCHQEVERKLWKMNMIPLAQEEIILHLMQHDFLNETRFAQSFARGKFRIKSWGKQRIARELKQRGISTRNITIALNEIPDDAYVAAFDTLSKKRYEQLRSEKNMYAKRKKFADYLLYRGWEPEWVYTKAMELIN